MSAPASQPKRPVQAEGVQVNGVCTAEIRTGMRLDGDEVVRFGNVKFKSGTVQYVTMADNGCIVIDEHPGVKSEGGIAALKSSRGLERQVPDELVGHKIVVNTDGKQLIFEWEDDIGVGHLRPLVVKNKAITVCCK